VAARRDRHTALTAARHGLEYAAVRAVEVAVRPVSWRVAHAAGVLLGWAFYAADRPHRELAIANLQAAFPLRTPSECRAIARATFAHFGRLLVELLKFSRLPPDRLLARVTFEGRERVEDALAGGRGVLLFTGHFGFWEQHALAHALALGPMAVVARPLDNPHLHALLERVRTATGNTVIYRRGGIRRILRALAANGVVAMLIDQHVQAADAVAVEFFGRPAATTPLLAALALRTGAPVIPAFALPAGHGRYRLVYEPPVEPPPGGDPEAIRTFTQRCTDVLEMYVRRYPALWLWMHRRWRDGEPLATTRGMFPAAEVDGE
jgi:KDO2-lipid IV(A) lauroyltransferase